MESPLGVATESPVSAVSWQAVFAGAVAAVSVSLILIALGTGLGFAMVSPWPGDGASATTFTLVTAIWLIVVQWLASGVGGYLTGRLRTKWARLHTHEVFFRDTAHGFVTWALATLITAAVLTSVAASVVGAGVRAVSTVASGAAQGATSGAANAAGNAVSGYDVDSLFRSEKPDANASAADTRAEVTGILARSLTTGELPAADRTYLAQLIAARTGVSEDEADKRIGEVTARMESAKVKAKEAADAARKAGALASLYTALSLLVGAFIASVAAALGGRQRDEHL